MNKKEISTILKKIEEKNYLIPVVDKLAYAGESPYKILVTVMMSARTKDETTAEASKRLFTLVDTPEDMLKISEEDIKKAIYPVGFYNIKAKNIISLTKILISKYNGIVPSDLKELMSLPGVGLKSATLVRATVFDKDELCVDIHVHRISNRLGWVKTKTPTETHCALNKIVLTQDLKRINQILVSYGKTICRPVGPKCKHCIINYICNYFSKS